MLSRLRIALVTVAVALTFSARGSTQETGQEGTTAEQRRIVEIISTIFNAILTQDVAKFDSVIAPDFYIFEGGSRFSRKALMDLVKAQHAAGKRYEWNVTEPDVHISGDTAWIAYVNKGSITDGSGTINQQWLESAFLQKQGAIWKIVFMHSTRVPNPPQENQRQ